MSAAIRAAARRAATALASSTARPVAAKAAAVPAPRRGLATLVSRRGGVLSSTAGPHSAAWPASTAARPQHRRATAAFASAAPNTGLADALDDEIKYEADNYDAPEVRETEKKEGRAFAAAARAPSSNPRSLTLALALLFRPLSPRTGHRQAALRLGPGGDPRRHSGLPHPGGPGAGRGGDGGACRG